ncbi:MAG: sugar ABC transporter ATP-binding protein, partial [Clostridia bacterium]|nr:sugar ABC transporter ATP-binding protein [Clostridia bacterium]
IDAKVDVLEMMGAETFLYLNIADREDNVVARVDPRSGSREGDAIKVAFDLHKVCFFDKETEQTLLKRTEWD